MRGDSGFPVRIRFAKRGKVRFISHRDVARAFERAFRVEQLPLAFTEGFSPRPKVSFGLALSVGHESDAEYLDVELAEPVDVALLAGALSDALPEGMDVTGTAPPTARPWPVPWLPPAGGTGDATTCSSAESVHTQQS